MFQPDGRGEEGNPLEKNKESVLKQDDAQALITLPVSIFVQGAYQTSPS